MADCRPLVCRNAALTPANHHALTGHLAALDVTLADGERLAPTSATASKINAARPGRLPDPTRPGALAVKRALPDTDAVKAANDHVVDQAAST
ncbi:hypothetical protein [Streptomyces hokutonensis]|uniref:hypothetical protein n=1 Tax=Streptomyces hokutonensis TaxID=1306990 RepID=UPI0036CFFC1D